MLDRETLSGLLTGAGLHVIDVTERALARPLEPWLEQAGPAADAATEIRRRLDDELAGASPTGFAPRATEAGLMFTQTFAACVAVR